MSWADWTVDALVIAFCTVVMALRAWLIRQPIGGLRDKTAAWSRIARRGVR